MVRCKMLMAIPLLVLLMTDAGRADDAPSFARDIRPILAAKCFACHGPDEETRKGELRLDERASALESEAFVSGKPDESELIRRIFSNDPDERMPPAESKDSLTQQQKLLLKRWVAGGADYAPHWAFVPPRRPSLPVTKFAERVSNPIDNFVFARLEKEGLAPSPTADRHTLARRLFLDLIGLPPTPEEADAFVRSDDPRAYEKLVDRLLQSKQYGERWAREWLDLARYADTNGYEKDRPRSIWPYRDWVIRALNDDMPYDRFTVEQLAGDMLPNATNSQRVATGFHRNTMLNEEGGIDPLEYRFYAMVDRVATTGSVWLGLTTGCAQCHSHKYDPLSHDDYYGLMALMDNADEPDLAVDDAKLAARRAELLKQIESLEAQLPSQFPPDRGEGDEQELRKTRLRRSFQQWIDKQRERAVDWTILRPERMSSNLPRLELLPDGSVFSSGDVTKRDVFKLSFRIEESQLPVTALRLEVLPDERLPAGGPGRAYYEGRKGDFFLSELTAKLGDTPIPFAAASHSYGKISIGSGKALAESVFDGKGSTGWSTSGREGKPSRLVVVLKEPLQSAGELHLEFLFERHFAASLGRFRLSRTAHKAPAANATPVEIEALLTRPEASWSKDDRARVMRRFLRVAPELAAARKKIDQLRKQLPAPPMTMVLQERPADNHRPTHRHHRGEYLNPRELIKPGLPALFRAKGRPAPTDRLQLARWLVSEQNPLAARVAVNRAWQALMGAGLVRSSGDFGTQSDPPTHPKLLDWLATEFVARGWSNKKLHRLIVTSATYRQRSSATHNKNLVERDPTNRLLGRGPRFRVPAETVRDIMLKASGLMSPKMFGPSVYPPQPASVTGLAYGNTRWNTSKGEDRYRRSLYTFSKRTAPFAAYLVFDSPTGENCVARRNRSNTPLQALTLLNDEMFLEMSRALASSAFAKHPQAADDCATWIFRRMLTRPPEAKELAAIIAFQQAQLKRLKDGELKAAEIAGGKKETTFELASWMMTARAVMNLDESITKP